MTGKTCVKHIDLTKCQLDRSKELTKERHAIRWEFQKSIGNLDQDVDRHEVELKLLKQSHKNMENWIKDIKQDMADTKILIKEFVDKADKKYVTKWEIKTIRRILWIIWWTAVSSIVTYFIMLWLK